MVGLEVGRGGIVTSRALAEIWGQMNVMWSVCKSDPPPRPSPRRRCGLMQVWFQNRRSKERRMKQLSALGARRHAFFRGPRRMRPLGGRLEDPDILGPGAYGYYGGKGTVFSCYFSAKCLFARTWVYLPRLKELSRRSKIYLITMHCSSWQEEECLKKKKRQHTDSVSVDSLQSSAAAACALLELCILGSKGTTNLTEWKHRLHFRREIFNRSTSITSGGKKIIIMIMIMCNQF